MLGNFGYGPAVAQFAVPFPTEPVGIDPKQDPRWMPPDHSANDVLAQPGQGFLMALHNLDSRMVVFFNKYILKGRGCWVIWRPTNETGEWGLVTPVWDPDTEEPWPCDNRTLAILYDSDIDKQGGLKAAWRKLRARFEAQEEARRQRNAERFDAAMEAARSVSQIRVGYGYSPGDRAAKASMAEAHDWGEKDNPLL